MYCTMPVVFRQTDLPPALGPEMTRMCFRRSSCRSIGTISRPAARSVCCSSGWRALLSTSRSSVERIGRTHPFSEAQRPLGAQHVHLGQVVARGGDQLRIGANPFGKLREDAHDLAPLGILQLAQFVVDLHDLHGFDVEGLSRGRFVVNETVDLSLVGRRHGITALPVADRDLGVALDDPRPLGGGQYGLQPLGGLSLALADRPADLQQGRRGVVAHVAEAVEDRLDALHDLGKAAMSRVRSKSAG